MKHEIADIELRANGARSALDGSGTGPASQRCGVGVPLGVRARWARAKLAYTTGPVPLETFAELELVERPVARAPRAGDLVLARVEAIGHHKRLELRSGRRAQLFRGDEIVVCFGNRYAPDQFEAEIPSSLEPCDLVAAGGVAGQMLNRHARVGEPTRIAPIGLLAHRNGRVANLSQWRLPRPVSPPSRPPTFAVLGTSMNAGKTTMAANLVNGFVNGGHRVGAAKVTGTGAGGDLWHLADAGAEPVIDFTAAGMVSTYLAPPEAVADCFELLTNHVAGADVDAIVLEVADGIFQRETATLLRSPVFRRSVDGVLFAGSDALGVSAGLETLKELGLPVLAASGVVTSSPLAKREAEARTGLPVLDTEGLRDIALLASAGIEARTISTLVA